MLKHRGGRIVRRFAITARPPRFGQSCRLARCSGTVVIAAAAAEGEEEEEEEENEEEEDDEEEQEEK